MQKKKKEEVVFVEKPASTVYSSLTATPFGKFRNIRLMVPKADFLLQSAAAFALKYTQVTKMKRDKAWGVSSAWVIHCKHRMWFLLTQTKKKHQTGGWHRPKDNSRNKVAAAEVQFQELRQKQTNRNNKGWQCSYPSLFIRLESKQSPWSAMQRSQRLESN